MSERLYDYLADVEQTVTSLAEKEQVTEKSNAVNITLWVQKTNNVHNRATNYKCGADIQLIAQ